MRNPDTLHITYDGATVNPSVQVQVTWTDDDGDECSEHATFHAVGWESLDDAVAWAKEQTDG